MCKKVSMHLFISTAGVEAELLPLLGRQRLKRLSMYFFCVWQTLPFSWSDPPLSVYSQIHVHCTRMQPAPNDHIRRTGRRQSPWWFHSQNLLLPLHLTTFCLLLPSSIFMLPAAFASVTLNMDAAWREERRVTFHCHVRIDRETDWWLVFFLNPS